MASVYDSVGYLTIEDDKILFSTFASINCPEAWQYIYTNHSKKITIIFSPYIHESWKLAGSIIGEEAEKVSDLLIGEELFKTNELWVERICGQYLYLKTPYTLSLNFYKLDLESIEKIDNETYILNSYVTIDFPDDLEIKTYDFNDSGEIVFTALRLSDETFVTGIMDSENAINILTESSDKEYSNLTQLN